MAKVGSRRFSSYFKGSYSDNIDPAYRKLVYYSRRRVINKVSFLTVSLAALLVFGFFDPHLLFVAAAIAALVGISYVRTRKAASGLSLRRIAPLVASRNERVGVGLEIINGSRYTVGDLVVRDVFTGSRDRQSLIWVDSIRPKRKWSGSYVKSCDVGMGAFRFSELSIVLMDPLGIFEFKIESEQDSVLVVFREPKPIPQLPVRGFRESFAHGLYTTTGRSGTANFVGLRPYVRGDSLRHVSWKAYARQGKLLVKEFEAVANTDVTILLDMNMSRHAGVESDSTWEYTKDAALAILAQQLANGNRVGLISQNCHIPLGAGETHFQLLSQSVFRLRPVPLPPRGPDAGNLVALHRPLFPEGSNLIYIGPVIPPLGPSPGASGDDSAFAPIIKSLADLRAWDITTICLLIDAGSFARGKKLADQGALVVQKTAGSGKLTQAFAHELLSAGVETYVLEREHEIGRSLLPREPE